MTLSDEEIARFLHIAANAARGVSRDPEVVTEAADTAVQRLMELLDSVSTDPGRRDAWIRTVARNHARRVGEKLHREAPFGRQGSLPPKVGDEPADAFVETVIAEMHHGPGSLGSLVAGKVDFERAWSTLSEDARRLLHAKYVDGHATKEIAEALGRTPGAVDVALTRAKAAARPLLQDLYDSLAR